MTTEAHATIDLIGYHATDEVAQLVIVEQRPWGADGLLLNDLEAKHSGAASNAGRDRKTNVEVQHA